MNKPVRFVNRSAVKQGLSCSTIRKTYNLLIGERTAEELKKVPFGSASIEKLRSMQVRGREHGYKLPRIC